jgi:hypothetical protein
MMIWDPWIEAGGNLLDMGGNLVDDIGDSVGDFFDWAHDLATDPTGRKAAADEMKDIYNKQMALNQLNWNQYLGNYDDLNAPARQNVTDFFDTEYMLPGATQFQNNLRASDYYYPGINEHKSGVNYDAYAAMVPEAQQYQFDPFSIEQDAGYRFAKQQGEDAILRRNAAGSGTLGPATTKAMAEFNSGLAAQHANDAFGRWQTTQGMEQGAARDYRGDQLGNMGALYGLASDKERINYGYGRDTRADQLANVNQRYGVDTGMQNLDFTYGNQYFQDATAGALNRYNMDQGKANLGMNIFAAQNPLGYMSQQMQGTQGLANAAQAGGGNALWDWMNLLVKVI